MDFYQCNDEGLDKLCRLLQNVGKFNVPATINHDQECVDCKCEAPNADAYKNKLPTKRYCEEKHTYSNSENEKPTISTRNDVQNIYQIEQNVQERVCGTYFINVSRCDCCAATDSTVDEEHKGFKRVINEVHNCGEMFEPSTKYRKEPCYASNKESISEKECECKRNGNSRRRKSKSRKVETSDESSTSDSDVEEQKVKHKRNMEQAKSKKQSKQQQYPDKLRDEEDTKRVKHGVKAVQTEKETPGNAKSFVAKNDTNENVQELLDKVRKYEKILETTDKVLKNNSPVSSKTISDTSSVDSVKQDDKQEINPPYVCDVPNCKCRQKYQQCKCAQKHQRTSSKAEALQLEEAFPIVLPAYLVAKTDNETEYDSTNTHTETAKRLEAGTNQNCSFADGCSLMSIPLSAVKLKFVNEDSDDNMSQAIEKSSKIVCLICTKN